MSHELRIQNCISRLIVLRDSSASIGLFVLLGSIIELAKNPAIQTEDLIDALERATVEAEAKHQRETNS